MWKWVKQWTGEGPPRAERTFDELVADALHQEAEARERNQRPGSFRVTRGEYVELCGDSRVDFIYEAGLVQRPTFMGLFLEVVRKP